MLDKYFDLFVALIAMLVAAIVSVVIYFILKAKKRSQKVAHYDERQIILRREACELSFITLLVYLFVCGYLEIFGVEWCENGVAIYIGLMIAFGIFMVAATLKDCLLRIKENRKTIFILTLILLFVSGCNCALAVIFNDYINGGKLTIDAVNVVYFAVVLAFFISQLIVNHRIKVEEKEDGAE